MKSQIELLGVFQKASDGNNGFYFTGELDPAALRRLGRDQVAVSCVPGEHLSPALSRLLGQDYEMNQCLFVFGKKRPPTGRKRRVAPEDSKPQAKDAVHHTEGAFNGKESERQ